jgi:hypothetical protein
MPEHPEADGVVYAVLERLEKLHLPRVLEIKKRVDEGEKLSEPDLEFLGRVMNDAEAIKPLVDQRPDLQSLYMRALGLYQEITAQALKNEESS